MPCRGSRGNSFALLETFCRLPGHIGVHHIICRVSTMRSRYALSVLAWLMLLTATVVQAAPVLPQFTELVQANSPAVVNVESRQAGGDEELDQLHSEVPDFFRRFFGDPERPPAGERVSSGSGFVIDSDGLILTNHHVVDGATEVIVRFNDRRELKAEVVGKDEATDIALLRVDADDLPTVDLGDTKDIQPGQWVIAIGSPFNFDYSVTAGIISAVGRSLGRQQYVPFIQTDVPINRGNSGGPLINMDGKVIGINSQIFSSTGGYMGLSFAIPIDIAMGVVEQLRERGQVARGYLGVGYQEVTRDLGLTLGLKRPHGALINNVSADSAAEKGDIRVRDVILEFNGVKLVRATQLPPLVGMTPPGAKVSVVVLRDGKRKQLKITLGEAPTELQAQTEDVAPEVESDTTLGLSIADLTAEQREQTGLDGGVLVRKVESVSAQRAGMRAGDVITMVDNQPVDSVKALKRTLERRGSEGPVALLIWRDGGTRFVVLR